MCLLFKRRLPPQSDNSLIWDQAGDTDLIPPQLVNVNFKVSSDGKQDVGRGSFVVRVKIVAFNPDTVHELQDSLKDALEVRECCLYTGNIINEYFMAFTKLVYCATTK